MQIVRTHGPIYILTDSYQPVGALFKHEHQERARESDLRRQAIIDLGRRGIIATEPEIVKWKAERLNQTPKA
jgi:hypothetical protein